MSLFCTITPTRGDRPELLEFCKHQLKRMTVRPEHSYFIDYEPTANVVDLTPRIKEGIRRAQRDGFDQVFIIEDDDYYSPQYFEAMCFNKNTPANFLGIQRTIYYNLRYQRFSLLSHSCRSSLFTTAFRLSAMNQFIWPLNTDPFLDIAIWRGAPLRHCEFIPLKCLPGDKPVAIGIKHGIGLCGGKGHKMQMNIADESMLWLKQNTDADAYTFYHSLMKKNGWA